MTEETGGEVQRIRRCRLPRQAFETAANLVDRCDPLERGLDRSVLDGPGEPLPPPSAVAGPVDGTRGGAEAALNLCRPVGAEDSEPEPGQSRAAFRDRLDVDDATWERGQGWALWKALVACAGAVRDGDGLPVDASFVLGAIVTAHERPD